MKQEADTATSIYPTETIDLPSKGLFYPEGSPLRTGQIELKYMTAKEEDILTSTNLFQKGIILDKLLDSLIVTKGVKTADLLVGDVNAVMVASRILGYGKKYEVKIPCRYCGNDIEHDADLTELGMENQPDETTKKNFTIVLPLSQQQVTLRLLTRKDELDIEKETKAMKKANPDISTESTSRLRAMILSVGGDSSKNRIWSFVDNLLVQDARYLREAYRKLVPDVNFNIEIQCSCNDMPQTVRLPIGVNFFWPDARV